VNKKHISKNYRNPLQKLDYAVFEKYIKDTKS